MTLEQLLHRLEMLVKGLIYISETDASVVVFQPVGARASAESLTARSFIADTRRPPLTDSRTQSFDDFFPRLVAGSQGEAWARLRDFLTAYLKEKVVFLIFEDAGDDFRYKVFIVGLFEGKIVGCQTEGVAT